MLFAKALKQHNIGDLLANLGSAGAGPAGPATGGATTGAAEEPAAAEEEPAKEDEPEDVDMGGLFGDDDEYD